MNRKEWLETFLFLADNNKSAREYRRRLGLKPQELRGHVRSIPQYRLELERIEQEEKKKARNVKQRKAKTKEYRTKTFKVLDRQPKAPDDDHWEGQGQQTRPVTRRRTYAVGAQVTPSGDRPL